MSIKSIAIALLLALTVAMSGCFGSMRATTHLKTWNREIENRWVGEGTYVLLRIPYGGVYTVVFLTDILGFNAVEFWGGENPVSPVDPSRFEAVKALDEKRHGN